MGKLISVDGEWATYEYYPDFIKSKSICGTFKVKPTTLLSEEETKYEFINRIDSISLGFNRPETQIIFALLVQIRKSAELGELFPKEIYHVA